MQVFRARARDGDKASHEGPTVMESHQRLKGAWLCVSALRTLLILFQCSLSIYFLSLILPFLFVLLFCFVCSDLTQVLTMHPRLAWNSLCVLKLAAILLPYPLGIHHCDFWFSSPQSTDTEKGQNSKFQFYISSLFLPLPS